MAPTGCHVVTDHQHPDDRVSLAPLSPLTALRALLRVDPNAPPADSAGSDESNPDHVRYPDRPEQ